MKKNQNNMAQPDLSAQSAAPATYPVTVDGQTREMTIDELIAAAESALSQTPALPQGGVVPSAPLPQGGSVPSAPLPQGGAPSNEIYAAFVREYPDIAPEDIPPEVWQLAQQEGSLVSAYRKWEVSQLKNRLAALEQNGRNRRQSVGSAKGDGQVAASDPVALALLG